MVPFQRSVVPSPSAAKTSRSWTIWRQSTRPPVRSSRSRRRRPWRRWNAPRTSSISEYLRAVGDSWGKGWMVGAYGLNGWKILKDGENNEFKSPKDSFGLFLPRDQGVSRISFEWKTWTSHSVYITSPIVCPLIILFCCCCYSCWCLFAAWSPDLGSLWASSGTRQDTRSQSSRRRPARKVSFSELIQWRKSMGLPGPKKRPGFKC